MLVRAWNVFVVVLWAGSMAALFYRDILPSWTAGDAPPAVSVQTIARVRHDRQAGIFDAAGRRVGTNWVRYIPSQDNVLVQSTTRIERLFFLPPLRILTRLTFRDPGILDEFTTRVIGAPVTVELKGENYDPDFACELKAGPTHYRWRMDSDSSRMLSEAFRPLAHLPDLYVGRSWQLRVIDPLSLVTDGSPRFDLVLVRVIGVETIDHHGTPIDCFVVESKQLKAYVAPNGEVLRQEFDVPGFGRYTLVDEPFNQDSLNRSGEGVRTAPDRASTDRPQDNAP